MEKSKLFASIKEIKDSIKSIRNSCAKLLEEKQTNDKINEASYATITVQNDSSIINVRAMFRLTQQVTFYYKELEKQKAAIQEKKEAIDNLNLEYQSKLYEQNQLKNEIQSCMSYPTPMLFTALHKSDIIIKSVESLDPEVSCQINEMLSNQLEQRKEMHRKYSDALKSKTQVEEELIKTKTKNEEFVSALKKLEDASQPLCKFFGVSSSLDKGKLKEGRLLPSLLYSIYGKVISYITSSKKQITIEIEESGSELQAYFEKHKEDKSIYNPYTRMVSKSKYCKTIIGKLCEKGTAGISKSIHKLKKKEKANDDKESKCPLSLILTVNDSSFLPKFRIPDLQRVEQQISDLLPVSMYFYYDNGKCIVSAQTSSNQFTSEELLHSLISLNEPHETDGDYEWAQIFSGALDYKGTMNDGVSMQSQNEEAINKTICEGSEVVCSQLFEALSYRISSLVSAQYQITYLHEKNDIPIEINRYINQLPTFSIFEIRSAIQSFEGITRDQYVQSTGNKEALKNSRYFELKVKCDESILIAYIELGINYYSAPPTFSILYSTSNNALHDIPEALLSKCNQVDIAKVNEIIDPTSGYAQCLHEMEKELNLYYEDYCATHDSMFVLCFQIKKLLQCADIFIDCQKRVIRPYYDDGIGSFIGCMPFRYSMSKAKMERRSDQL